MNLKDIGSPESSYKIFQTSNENNSSKVELNNLHLSKMEFQNKNLELENLKRKLESELDRLRKVEKEKLVNLEGIENLLELSSKRLSMLRNIANSGITELQNVISNYFNLIQARKLKKLEAQEATLRENIDRRMAKIQQEHVNFSTLEQNIKTLQDQESLLNSKINSQIVENQMQALLK